MRPRLHPVPTPVLWLATTFVSLATAQGVAAQTITFDDVAVRQYASVQETVPNYRGLHWDLFSVLNTTNNPLTPVGAVSAPNVIFAAGNGLPSDFFLAAPGTFTLGSMDFIRWDIIGRTPGASTTVTGYVGATQLFQEVVPLTASYATTVFNWSGIDRVTFAQSGVGMFVADNLVLGTVGVTTTPEPGTWTLLVAGLVGVAGVTRRRRRATAT